MQEKAKTLTRANYNVPKGEERVVHYTIEKVTYDNVTGEKTSKPILIKTGAKLFSTIKRDLELQGNVINILYHPEGLYNQEPEVKQNLNEEIKAKDAEIEALKAELERMREFENVAKEEVAESKKEEPAEVKPSEEKPKTEIVRTRRTK